MSQNKFYQQKGYLKDLHMTKDTFSRKVRS